MDVIKNRIPVVFDKCRSVTGPHISYQHDLMQFLVIQGIELPDYYVVDFCNEGDSFTIPITGNAEGVRIPDQYLLTGRNVKAYVILTGDDEGASETRYEITLPVRKRPARTDIDPTEEERLEIDELVDNMNDAVTRSESAAEDAEGSARSAASDAEKAEEAVFHYPKIVDGYWYVWTPDGWRTTGVKAEGDSVMECEDDGDGNITITTTAATSA